MTFRCRRRDEDDLRAVQPQGPRPFGKVTIITNVDADAGDLGFKSRKAEIARREVELLPESRQAMRDVRLAVLAQVRAVGVNHRRRVVVDAGHLFFINRHNHRHAMCARDLLHQPCRRALRDAFDQIIPVRVLLGGEVWAIEKLLQADDLHATAGGVFDHSHMLIDHSLLDLFNRAFGRLAVGSLYESASHDSRHGQFSLSEY